MGYLWILLILFATGFIAGLVDAIAGGGGLITVPALLAVGLPPQVAIGTNKLQSSFGSGSAMAHFARAGTVRLRDCVPGIAATAVGAGIGALAVQSLDPDFLRRVIPFMLIAIAGYLLAAPRLGYEEVRARLRPLTFYLIFGLAIGCYDGFFGPGTGTFWAMAFMLCLGQNLTRATAHTKVMNFTSNIVSLGFFIASGVVRYPEGLAMGAGQFLGARVGARLVISRGTRFVRPVFLAMVLLLSLKLLLDAFRTG